MIAYNNFGALSNGMLVVAALLVMAVLATWWMSKREEQ